MKKILFFYLGLTIVVSCVENSAEYRKLKIENDSLKLENAKTSEELNGILSVLHDIQTDIDAIREAENYLNIQQTGELSQINKEQIRNNILLIAETLKSNREQLSALQEQLNKSKLNSTALQKTIDRINSDLNQKALLVASLQEELAKKDIRLKELDEIVTSLNENVESLSVTNAVQSQRLSEQDKKMHTAYYCFGTKKELKEQNILSGGGLFSKSKALEEDFNKDYFIAIDIRDVTKIQLYAHKAKIRSNHPDHSYKFTKDENENLVLNIVDINLFWSLGKYLVIEIG